MNSNISTGEKPKPHRSRNPVTPFLWAIPIVTWLLLIALYGFDFHSDIPIDGKQKEALTDINTDDSSDYLSFSE